MGNQTVDQDVSTEVKAIEDEVLELTKQECVLLESLRDRQCTIALKQAQAGQLENSLLPVYRLPTEILQACFYLALQTWLSEHDFERKIADQLDEPKIDWERFYPYESPFVVSHVSCRFRQLAINFPSLWTNLLIAPSFIRHMDVLQEFLLRVKGMPCSVIFLSFGSKKKGSIRVDFEAIKTAMTPLVKAGQITALAFLDSAPAFSFVCSLLAEQPITGSTSPNVLSNLTALTLFEFEGRIKPAELRSLLSTTPQLKSIGLLGRSVLINEGQEADKSPINLPMLNSITTIETFRDSDVLDFVCLLSVPNLYQFNLISCRTTSFLFIDNDDKKPRFPSVRSLVFSGYGHHYNSLEIIRAFPKITHLTLWNPGIFECTNPQGAFWRELQHFTLDCNFPAPFLSTYCITWLYDSQKTEQSPQTKRSLQISVFDPYEKLYPDSEATKHKKDLMLFSYYEVLQDYGSLEEESIRLDEYRQWTADGKPGKILFQ
ncbi:hypothetical protein BJ138DRAFT_757702 [Hygrophoropsis aurantiaca]|uniref:Uncharacterized protein n=1 Tax=Hygrophoropsis aurantiaca TaxID=72124 RepID=A0ACB7ZXN4_9AGAM|nr:hypothetical protein BJ138DRAFT_757702 [Hygrophoropsis aurantiaca]